MPGFLGRENGKSSKEMKNSNYIATRKRKREANVNALYRNSASVPDSLVAFTDEIHKVKLGKRIQKAARLNEIRTSFLKRRGREPSKAEWCESAENITVKELDRAVNVGLEAKNRRRG